MIKVIITDDQKILRESLKYIIEHDAEIEVVACAENGREALQLCDRLSPDLVLMDIMMPDCDGVEGTKLIKEKHKEVKVLILTTFNEAALIKQALKNGADGYILKDIIPEELIMAVKSAAKGLAVIHPDAINTIVNQQDTDLPKTNSETKQIDYQLTEREISILALIVDGKSNKEIASTLYLTEGTVKNLITALLTKLNLKDRTQLAVFAVKNNIV